MLAGGLDPAGNSIVGILQCLCRGFPICHATGQVRNARNKAASVLIGQRADIDMISANLIGHRALTSSISAINARIYTGLIGRLKGTVRIFGLAGWLIL